MTRDLTKRDLLRIGIVSAGSVFTGCMTTASESSEQQITIPDEPPCADDLQIKQIAATVGGEVHPVVELQVENQGSNPISYELQVIFEQGTSLGIDARTGRSTVTETVDGGEIITHRVSDNARDIKNTDSYIVNVVAVNCQDERT